MTAHLDTGVLLLAMSLVCWLLHRGLRRISGQVAAVADSLGNHILDDAKQHEAHRAAIRQVWQALPGRRP